MSKEINKAIFQEGHAIFVSCKKEQKELIKFLEELGFKLMYEELRNNDKLYPCWCVQGDTFALIGTQALRGIKKEKIFQNLEDFRSYSRIF
mgnify:CR=1 FL=1